MLLPDQPGDHPHLVVVEGKGGVLYLVDRDHMGRYQAANNSHAVQTISIPDGVFGSMTYWNHYLYVVSDSDALREFEVKDGRLSFKARSGNTFAGVSATPTVSADVYKRQYQRKACWGPPVTRFADPATQPALLMSVAVLFVPAPPKVPRSVMV